MNELAQHIEALLLENDCVIVPGLGGFVAHYAPAMRVAEENLFLPPARVVGFNPQLKMNDGLLVQSYMAAYGTDFSDATRRIEKEVERLSATLHEEGKADLPNIGELRYSIRGTYDFAAYDHRVTTPALYGLDSFEMQELAVMKKPYAAAIPTPPPMPERTRKRRRRMEVKLNRAYLANAAAMVAAIALFFLFSTPIENTEVVEGNYAQLLPSDLFEMIEKKSLAIQPIAVAPATHAPKASLQQKSKEQKRPERVTPVAVKEVKVNRPAQPAARPKQPAAPQAATPAPTLAKRYHIIVASVGTQKDAEALVKLLAEKGHRQARVIAGDGKVRVSIDSCDTEAEAYRTLNKVRQEETYKTAWVLKK